MTYQQFLAKRVPEHLQRLHKKLRARAAWRRLLSRLVLLAPAERLNVCGAIIAQELYGCGAVVIQWLFAFGAEVSQRLGAFGAQLAQ